MNFVQLGSVRRIDCLELPLRVCLWFLEAELTNIVSMI